MSSPSRPQADLFAPIPDEPRHAARPFDIAQAVRAIWYSGIDPSGTLTDQYAAALGLPLPDDVRGRVIRHHGSLAFAKGRRLPGMLTQLRELDGDRPVAVVRTYLDPDARKVAQRILGPAFRAAAMFDPGEHVALNVALGMDAGIRALALGHRPLWAVASAEALANLQPAGVEALSILVEAGDGNATRAATAAAARWESAGRTARMIEIATKPAAREAARP